MIMIVMIIMIVIIIKSQEDEGVYVSLLLRVYFSANIWHAIMLMTGVRNLLN